MSSLPSETVSPAIGADDWEPPSSLLRKENGVWRPAAISTVSYPEEGNDLCYRVEDFSYWFSHRNACLLALMKRLPPAGTFFDVGGGNGYVSSGLQGAGFPVALLEPGAGAWNARKRGIHRVIQATLDDARLEPGSVTAAGAFDVIEHIEDDVGFLRSIRRSMAEGGRFYFTVPASMNLWSDQDEYAGHYRRYEIPEIRRTLSEAGFKLDFVSHFFSWLVCPLFLLRSLPFRFRGSRVDRLGTVEAATESHTLPRLIAPIVRKIHEWERRRLEEGRELPFGSSLIGAAVAVGADSPSLSEVEAAGGQCLTPEANGS